MREVFRPRFGRALTWAVALLCGVVLIALVVTDGLPALLLAGPWLALVGCLCWGTFWRPEVVVEDSGVQIVNVFRTIALPWPSVHAIDTKWALTLITAYGKFTAWAAPSPGRHTAVRASQRDAHRLPAAARSSDGIRPGDLPSSESGNAALLIRRRWELLQDAGHLDDPRLEFEKAPITWHRGFIATGVGLLALAISGLVL